MDQMQSPTHSLQHHHQQPQQQQQQHSDSSPQDVLAEARKNLQLLIDSGLSRDVLHQLLDDGQSAHQLAVPSPSSILQSQQMPLQSSQEQAQVQVQVQSQPQPQLQPDQTEPQPQSHMQSTGPSANYIPPVPQCPPPPPPIQQKNQQQQQQQQHLEQQPQQPQSSFLSPPMTKPPTPSMSSSPVDMKPEQPHMADDAALFLQQLNAPFAAHRPRISVSSTSSGSSGTASIWSNASAQSSMSWASTGSNASRMQAPLPLPPQLSPTGTPLMNGGQVGASGAASKQNIYWCTSCETSFKRKYDWKRHEDEFHERWRKYPCPEPGCNRSFWGSNSFNQHHKQCHGCKTCPHAEKVVRFLRKRKYWACGFCSALHPARERHVEHVARHFESGMTKAEWMHSRVIYGLLHQPLIHEAWEALVISKQPSYGARRPRFSWHPSRTGRAQGFLEKENPGQLQDLLEFFSSDEGDAQWIVSVAYDLADIIVDNSASPLAMPQMPEANNAIAPQPYPSPDPRMSFSALPLPVPPHQQQQQQQQPPMLPSSDASAQNPFATPAFRTPMLVPSQSFSTGAGPSPPESTSHSPLTSNHSPCTPSHPPTIKEEIQPQQQPMTQPPADAGSEGMMDFEYSPAPVIYEAWAPMPDASMDQTGASQPNWGMLQYYNDPRVTS